MSSVTNTSNFVELGPGCWLKKAETNNTDDDTEDPSLIIVFGWMGAKLPHLFKYTDTYSHLYPHATQILVQSSPSFFWSTQATRQAKLKPVAEALVALGFVVPPQREQSIDGLIPQHRILVHAFSNGGSEQMVTLGKVLQGYTVPTPHRTPSALILDSAPGTGGLRVMIQAFVIPIASTFKRLLMTAFITGLWAFVGLKSLFGVTPPLVVLQHNMWNPRFLPWMDAQTPRLYMYSKLDALVPWQDVANHVEGARQRGVVNVEAEVFEDTEHVAHARREPERYWKAVQAIWNRVTGQGDHI